MLNLLNQSALIISYSDFLAQNNIAKTYEPFYLKWLRFYLDFCQKYSHQPEASLALPKFVEKLKEKNNRKSIFTKRNTPLRSIII